MSSSYIVVGNELARIQGDLDLIEVAGRARKPQPLLRGQSRTTDRGVKDDTRNQD